MLPSIHLMRVAIAGATFAGSMAAQSPMAMGDCHGQLKVCLVEEARAATEAIGTTRERDRALYAIAAAQVAMGDFVGADATTREIVEPRYAAQALVLLAETQARLGHLEAALDAAQRIVTVRERPVRYDALQAVAVGYTLAGSASFALQVVEEIKDPLRLSEARAAVVAAQARTGDRAGALETAHRQAEAFWATDAGRKMALRVSENLAEEAFWYFEAVVYVAAAEAEAGNLAAALATAHSIVNLYGRARALEAIAIVQTRVGDFQGAMTTASQIEAPFGDLGTLNVIVEERALRGQFEPALDLALRVAEAYDNRTGLILVAREQARAGNVEDALHLARGIRDSDGSNRALSAVAAALWERGDFLRARDVIDTLSLPRAHVAALEELALAQARAGKGAAALATVGEAGGNASGVDTLASVSAAQADSGDIAGALENVPGMNHAYDRALVLAAIARALD